MSPLILVIEIIGHLARIMSLSFRLFGNIMGHELVLGILFMLAGVFFAPLPIMAISIFVSFVQAFVFFLLSIMFALAMEPAHRLVGLFLTATLSALCDRHLPTEKHDWRGERSAFSRNGAAELEEDFRRRNIPVRVLF